MSSYSIGTVARLTGLPTETIRIWERRYGVIEPTRTEGGHRLYTDADVDVLRAIKKLAAAGGRIGALARMPRERLLADARVVQHVATTTESEWEPFIAEAIEAAQAYDPLQLEAVLDRPRLHRLPDDVAAGFYLPLMARAGDMWHAGLVAIGVEHLIEKAVTSRLHTLLNGTRAVHEDKLALCACPPGERHEVGLLAAALVLKSEGMGVMMLGADLPVEELERAAAGARPKLIALSFVTETRDDDTEDLAQALGRAPCARSVIALGGPGAQKLARLLAARGIAHELCRSIDAIRPIARSLIES